MQFAWRRWAPIALFLLLGLQAVLLLHAGLRAAAYPFEIDYGEGIVWYQARLILAGQGYGDIAGIPAIVFHYPPVYHLLAGGLEASGLDGLAGGRLLSLASTVAFSLTSGLIAFRLAAMEGASSSAARLVGLVAALLIPALSCVQNWAALMRVDMLAFAFGFAGFYFALRALERPRLIHAAALAFLLAVFTKQTSIAAPAAVFGILILARPRLAWAGIATCLVGGFAVLAAMAWATDGNFLRHIFLYNVNRFDWSRSRYVAEIAAGHLIILSLACWALWARRHRLIALWTGPRTAGPADLGLAMLALYFLVTVLMLPLVAKQGSNVNYLIEWLAVGAILSALSLRAAAESLMRDRSRALQGGMSQTLLWTALALQVALLPKSPYAVIDDRELASEMQTLTRTVARADGPVISDDMVVLIRAGRPVLWEPAIFGELASTGAWDETPLVAMLRGGRFAMVISMYSPGEERFIERYTPAVAGAIAEAYPFRAVFADRYIYLPSGAGNGPRAVIREAALQPPLALEQPQP